MPRCLLNLAERIGRSLGSRLLIGGVSVGVVSLLAVCLYGDGINGAALAQAGAAAGGAAKDAHPFLHALLPHAHKYLHPPIIHFPIVLTLLETLALLFYLRRADEFFDRAATWLLYLAAISVVPVVGTGLHDAGVDLGGNSAVLDGLKDRAANFLNGGDQLSVHVMCVCVFVSIVFARVIWRRLLPTPASKRAKLAFLAGSLVASFIVLVVAQAGGVMSHQ